MIRGFQIVVVFMAAFLLHSCTEKALYPQPEQILSEGVYLSIFYELELLRMFENQGNSKNKIDSLYATIFYKYEVESALFDSTHKYFQTQVDKQQIRTDTVLIWLQRDLDQMIKLDSLLSAQDTLNNE